MELDSQAKQKLDEALSAKGLRSTRQREMVYAVILDSDDHPSADAVYSRVRERMPSISLATVYNCLETLSDCELIRQINFERTPSRYCYAKDRLRHHAHFHCQRTGRVFDVDLPGAFVEDLTRFLPQGFEIEKIDLTLSGSCHEHRPEPVKFSSRDTHRFDSV